MSSSAEIERLQAEASYCRDRVSLMRAKLYRLGLGPSARLRELERELDWQSSACGTSACGTSVCARTVEA